MTRLLPVVVVMAWVGTALVLGELRWFRRVPLGARLAPYTASARPRRRVLSAGSFREVLAPLAQSFGRGTARALGVREDVATRLERVHSPLDPVAFRLRQLGWATAALAVSG